MIRSLAASSAVLDSRPLPGELDYLVPEGKTREQVEREAAEANEAVRKALEARYGYLERYTPAHEEHARAHLIFRYGLDGDFENARRLYDQLSREYPDSPLIPARYVDTLIRGKRIEEARSLVERARSRFPSDITLTVLSDL